MTTPTDPCPQIQYWDSSFQPWTEPQPGGNDCPYCLLLKANQLLQLAHDAGWDGHTNPTLTLHRTDGSVQDYALPEFDAGMTQAAYNLLTTTSDVSVAWLTTLKDGMSHTSPVFVVPE